MAISADQLLRLIVVALVLIGTMVGAAARPWWLRAALFIVAPVAAVESYHLINPDPGCVYDCSGKLGWTFLLAWAVGAWWIGLSAGILSRWLIQQLRGREATPALRKPPSSR